MRAGSIVCYNGVMTEFIQALTTAATREEAEQIAQSLVEERLAACAQVSGPIRSVYRWHDNVEQSDEWLCAMKTRQTLFAAVKARIQQHHSYECPEIIAIPIVEGSAAYLDWLGAQLANRTH